MILIHFRKGMNQDFSRSALLRLLRKIIRPKIPISMVLETVY